MGYCTQKPLGVFYGSNAKSSWKFLIEACRKAELQQADEKGRRDGFTPPSVVEITGDMAG